MKLLHRHDDQLRKLEELTTELERNPVTKQFREQEAAEILQKRQEAAEKIETLKQQAEHLAASNGVDTLVAKLNKLEAERQKLQTEIGEKRGRLMQEKAGIEAGIRCEEEILYASYDPKIDQVIEFFRKKLDELRSPGKISSQRTGLIKRNLFTETVKGKFETNCPAINAALRYCQQAISVLEQAKLQPTVDTAKLQELKDGIPRIDVYTEREDERVLPGSRAPNPLSLLPSDSAMDWKKNTVMEKAKEILKR